MFTLLKLCPGCQQVLPWPGSWSRTYLDHDLCAKCLSVALRLRDEREVRRIVRVAELYGVELR